MQQNEISDDFYIQCFENSQIMSVSKLQKQVRKLDLISACDD